MDKKNLYYIVQKGTNERHIRHEGGAWIGDKTTTDKKVAYFNEQFTVTYEAISIQDFKEKFQQEPEPCASDIAKAKV